MTQIAGKTAVVTGSGSGIGRGIALELAAQGARVVVADIVKDNADKVVGEITKAGGKAAAVACDVCDRASIKNLKVEANKAFGPVQLLFANAGATSFEPLMKMSDDDVDWILTVNLMGVTYCTRAFLPDMMAAKDGHVMATASMAGLLPAWIPVHAPYSAAKMGIIGMMFNLSHELKDYNIHTTTYCPGGVKSGMKENNARYRPARFGGPGAGAVHVPELSTSVIPPQFLPSTYVAKMVLQAVKNNRLMVVDHSDQRQLFTDSYAKYVMQAFDDAAAFEKANPPPPASSSPVE